MIAELEMVVVRDRMGGDYRWCVVSFGKDGNILLDLCW